MKDVIHGTATIGAQLARQPIATVMGVSYLHVRLRDGGDLYVTEDGRPFVPHLLPHNHCGDREWFTEHSVRLSGSSTVYRITTKPVGGRSKDIVLKWNRMGQDIPGETQAVDLAGAEFNSPFEEFSLVTELREGGREASDPIHAHKPLAIYVPRKHVEAHRMGRKRYRIEAVQQRHDEIPLDANRQYAVIYEWMEGIDAADAARDQYLDAHGMQQLTLRSQRELARKGFRVRDSKPHHVIVRPTRTGELARDADGQVLYGLVDFELLERTPTHEKEVKASKRHDYLVRQAHRFEAKEQFPPGLAPVSILDVDYVYAPVESTAGALWVVGRDPVLFDYFLPEKWRKTRRRRLPGKRGSYHTVTKDQIQLVWQVSKVGRQPAADPDSPRGRRILDHGYNSPFEEISFSMALDEKGIKTTYPRAIYMTGHKVEEDDGPLDERRYISHESLTTPDGHPILTPHHDYIVIWGYWNGPDKQLAVKDEQVYEGIYARHVRDKGLITEDVYHQVLAATAARLADAGFEDLGLRGDHLLLSLDMSGHLVTDTDGLPAVRLCSFDLLKRNDGATPPGTA